MRLWRLIPLLVVPLCTAVDDPPPPPVVASIVSSWPRQSLVALYAETLALEQPALLFPFLATLAVNPLPPGSTPAKALAHLLHLTPPPIPSTVNLSLALREASPALEAFRVLWYERDAGFEGGDEIECGSWVDVADRKACNAYQFWDVLGEHQKYQEGPLRFPDDPIPPHVYAFDHLKPDLVSGADTPTLPVVIFYTSLTSSAAASLFSMLDQLATEGRLRFAVRWKPADDVESHAHTRMALSGFGAAMDIKKIEYIAIDDRTLEGGASRETTTNKMSQVRKSDLQVLPFLATHHIVSSESPFSTFTTLLSAFPLLAPSLSTLYPLPLPSSLFQAMASTESHPLRLRPSLSIFLNGLPLPSPETLEPFALLHALRTERRLLESLQQATWGMQPKWAREILAFREKPMHGEGEAPASVLGERFDASERRGEKGAIVWWNDLTLDRRYESWGKNVQALLRPTYPGQLNLIALNLHNLVLALDLSLPSSLVLLTETIKTFISRGIPIRFGLVPIVVVPGPGLQDGPVAEEVARVFSYLLEAKGRKSVMEFLASLAKSTGAAPVTSAILSSTYRRFLATLPEQEPALESLEAVLASTSKPIERARAWLARLGLTKAVGTPGAFFLNGVYFPVDDDFTQNVQKTLSLHVQYLQQEVYLGRVTDSTDFDRYFFDLPGVNVRRNKLLIPDPQTNPLRLVNLVEVFGHEDFEPVMIEAVGMVTEEDFVEPPAKATLYVVADLETVEGRSLVHTALTLLDIRTDVRIAFLHNPLIMPSASPIHSYSLSPLLHHLHRTGLMMSILPSELVKWLDLGASNEGQMGPTGPGDELDTFDWGDGDPLTPFAKGGVPERSIEDAREFWLKGLKAVRKMGFAAGESGIVINGRVLGPFAADEFGGIEAFRTALEYEIKKRADPAIQAIASTDFPLSSLSVPEQSNLFAFASSILAVAAQPDPNAGMFGTGPPVRDMSYRDLDDNATMVVTSNQDTALFELAVVIDPVTELAQRWAPILETLAATPSIHVRLYFNPSSHLVDVPIKRFYQYSFSPSILFDAAGNEMAPGVAFTDLPEDVLFTFSMDVQRSWLAFPNATAHDLDNIRLADLPSSARLRGIEATFELESIIVEGHARDMPSSQPPRGLELELQSPSSSGIGRLTVDTICMANLGYFQLKANPGPWRLTIRPGRSSEVFALDSAGGDGWKSGTVEEVGDLLAVTTFQGLTIYPRFRRRTGHERTELLEDGESPLGSGVQPRSFLGRVQSMFPFLNPLLLGNNGANRLVPATKKADINIFTVASGLLYERMAFIMMVSVLRHTNSTVKFWFIQNFLSPSFKAFIPHMAQEYGFDYQLVTYKWPHWLRAQKEKQRTIWGYKILFLDVLFPLELDRVIFVDSDQIVRADLKELIDLDLEGAPYAYAPMGNDREETAGFRFWDSGYWKEHLRGRPYHISALYVVDLVRFRQIAAGDRLRQQYQGLSADPNSLANLDQDLPNNMQTSLPIYTLDRNWLWCATWCSDESLAQAKTIDLCNNPLTHEPKLARAKRIVPEWSVYDDEIAALARRVANGSAGLIGADAEVQAFSRKADDLVQAIEQTADYVNAGGEVDVEPEKEGTAELPSEEARGSRFKDEL